MSLLNMYETIGDESTRSRLMQCFGARYYRFDLGVHSDPYLTGSLFRSNPSLMTTEESASLMETVFSSSDLDARCGLLKTVHKFLLSESAKFEADLKGVLQHLP